MGNVEIQENFTWYLTYKKYMRAIKSFRRKVKFTQQKRVGDSISSHGTTKNLSQSFLLRMLPRPSCSNMSVPFCSERNEGNLLVNFWGYVNYD